MISIIMILAGLLLSAVFRAYGRAKRMQREFEGSTLVELFRDRLAHFAESQASFPPLTAQQFFDLGVFDSRLMDFLRWKGVTFHPFSSTDQGDVLILEVYYSKDDIVWMRKDDLKPRSQ